MTLHLGGGKGKEMNYFGIFLSFPCLGFLMVGESNHSSLFPQNIKFYSPRVGGIGQNEIRFNDFITKTPKCPIHLALYFKIRV